MQAKDIHNDVIVEASDAEEQNQTTIEIGKQLHTNLSEVGRDRRPSKERKDKYSRNQRSVSTGKGNIISEAELLRDRNRDSMFGTMLLNNMPTDVETRVR